MHTQVINQFRRVASKVTRGTAALGLAAVLALGALAANDAEAKRVGGSQSVGRQSQMASPSAPAQRSQQAQPAQQAAQAPAATPPRNRWLGPLAGLAAGLGIAALLSSLGLGAGLAQMLSNMLLIGLVVVAGVMLFRFIANRRRPDLAYGHGAASRSQSNGMPFANQNGQARSDSSFFGSQRSAANQAAAAGVFNAPVQPLGLDQAELVASAKSMFMRLQGAWDRNEQGDLFELTTPEMFAQLKRDLEGRGNQPNRTEVPQLDAEVLGVESTADETFVSVRFYGQMREDDAPTAQPFQEVWNIVRSAHSGNTWRLAGIQQLDR
ncbi:Tim44 domain-containing protein [bacterium M00.F.Ca.ET.228.01.1.1]|uniref:Tim44 domain-containing protein n=1 Tax=Paraburkholderia phenoliruptrix TaxID=252970 RepID=UPI001091AEAE|nr:TIM44-like domain-containing protein [Paraburkholderia phenoliruptrix]TGP47296.1 Tim44 domain-containing protein [bacterium M00.F.Ca.ET.228.01.1.1]TGS05088.1 Tim44 domain-containing protein [bacterium M00.F.Ca.ET.191.01.1.1]TGU10023.1 Tim44 domain-containing protein [bacterium M00.F.Ca.ET.155.01.1.1]MBW0446130.1 Tim44 domain-containing protein [Paraburkholderia phenoliruptrix]MBW9100132.1 Tim44 domain-containing protein [Paraburkholderia phenoliruptrix]